MVVGSVGSTPVVGRASIDQIWSWLADVADPEIPVISVVDLGIVRVVAWSENAETSELLVTITPTYSGCPATEIIADSIREALANHGVQRVSLKQQLSPAWTSDWLSEIGRKKLFDYGIAPPAGPANEYVIDASQILRQKAAPKVSCPHCGSTLTRLSSQFGSTPCKALYRCDECLEPFDYFKPH